MDHKSGNRLVCIDQVRAVAIAAMIIAHFAPGLVERVAMPKVLGDFVLSLGRIATPGFAAIFGVTVGLVYLPKFLAGESARATRSLLRRARIVAACALLVAALRFAWQWPVADMLVVDNLYAGYSVLLFYAVALLTLPLWLRVIARSPRIIALALAAASYLLVGLVRDRLWPPAADPDLLEFVRLLFFSGKYAYFLMMGTTFLFIPVGLHLHKLTRQRPVPPIPAALGFLTGGVFALSVIAPAFWTDSREEFVTYWNSRTLWVWYHVAFGCLAVFMLVPLDRLNRNGGPRWNTLGDPLALFGQQALAIYTAHVFILPALHLFDRLYKVEGPLRAAVPLLLFVAVCLVIVHRSRQSAQR